MTPSSRRKLGLTLIIIPPVALLGSIVLFPLFNFIFMTLAMRDMSNGVGTVMTVARVANVVLGFTGILGIGGVFTALPIGLYLFFSTPKTPAASQPPVIPPQV